MTQNITVDDNTKPTLTAIDDKNENVGASCSFTIPDYTGLTTAADNCTAVGNIIKTQSPAVGTVISGHNTSQLVTITANDGNGNTKTTSFTITLKDVTKPIIICPATATANTNNDGAGNCTTTVALGTPTATDNCTITGNFRFTAKLGGITINPVTHLFPTGNTTVVWTATDEAGNTSLPCNQIVRVTDNEIPSIETLANSNVTTDNGTCTFDSSKLTKPATNDNCGVVSVLATPVILVLGENTVTWTVKDSSGLSNTSTQKVTVVDNQPPSIATLPSINVSADFGTCTFESSQLTKPTATDNCGVNSVVAIPATLNVGTNTVTWTATDNSGLTKTSTQLVTVMDNQSPKAVCKDYTAVLGPNGIVNISALELDNGSFDNCGIVKMTVNPNSFTCNEVGQQIVTFTVFDDTGNSDQCTATVTVVDNTPPTMICQNFVVVVDAITRKATIKASDVDNGSNDACGIISLSVEPSVFEESTNVYTATTTLTAVDTNGNSNSCTATVTVEPPKNQFTYLTGIIVNPIPDNPQAASSLVEVTACPGGITIPKDIELTLSAIGTYNLQASDVLNWEYSDDNGETWTEITNTAGILTYTITGLTSDTFIRLRITDADDSSIIKTSGEAYIRFLPPESPPIIVSHTALDICLGNSVTVDAESYFDQPNGQFGEGGEFNYAQPDGWRVDGLDGFFPASGDNGNETTWKESNSNNNATFSGINYDTTDNTKFAIAHGVGNYTTLETPVFSTIGMTSSEAILNFNTSWYFCSEGYGEIWLSFDSGNTYEKQLFTNEAYDFDSRDGNTTSGVKLKSGPGQKCIGTTDPRMLPATINLGNYAGLSGLRVRFEFHGSTESCGDVSTSDIPNTDNVNNCKAGNSLASGWAIDAVGFAYAQVDDELEWTDEDGTVIARGTTAIVTPVTPGIREYGVTTLVNGCRTDNDSGTNFININTSLAYCGEDYTPLASECGENSIQLNAYDNTKTAVTNFNKGAWKTNLYVVPNTSNGDTDYLGTGVTGSWSVQNATNSSCGSSATFSSNSDPDAIFTADPGTYTLRWTLTNGCYDEITVKIVDCKSVDFDGINDYVSFKDNYNLNGNFSIETWVKPNSVNNYRTIFSRKDAYDNTKGYDLSIIDAKVKFNWYNNSGINTLSTGPYSIGTDRWYHLAVTFDGTTYKLYVDGLELATKNGTAPATTASTVEALLGAMDKSTANPTNNFHGWIDEVKIWNKALEVDQIRQMMNQEIDAYGADVGGLIIPLKISGSDMDNNGIEDNPIVWNDLTGYYRMTTSCGNLDAFKGVSGRLHNIQTSESQTAPIPYTSRISNHTWNTDNTWTHHEVWDSPNSFGINGEAIDWNIVKTNHKITSNSKDLTLLGLIVESNELIITNAGIQNETNLGHGLWLTHYLKLDGFIDLVGESQLVQKRYGYYDADNNFLSTQYSQSIFDDASSGYIEIDQQGQKNSYNYNYWSSPVSIRGYATNSTYTISDVLRDGMDSSNPKQIQFGNDAYFADGAISDPFKISNRWIWSYSSLTPDSNSNWDNYFQWKYKANTGQINAGEGFTMKGSGGPAEISELLNHVFTGKPNSGTIDLFIAQEQTYLIGNPYPCALDAIEFIKDNLKDCDGCRGTSNSFGGALYFWDHFDLSNNHYLAQYEGGYATYSLTGGVEAIADDPLTVNNNDNGTKIPERYVPVAQGFFIDAAIDPEILVSPATVTGGPIIFKNSQRAFVRESSGNAMFLKTTKSDKEISIKAKPVSPNNPRIRLGFTSPIGSHRQLLLGADSKTTKLYDYGYDAKMLGTNDNDMYWQLGKTPLVIQSIPDFNDDQNLPIGIKVNSEGESTIKIDALENVENSLEIYIYDNETGIYHDLTKNEFRITLAVGEYNKRFSLRFANKSLSYTDSNLDQGIIIFYNSQNNTLNVKNNFTDTSINSIYLFSLTGQKINDWKNSDNSQTYIQKSTKGLSSAVYIVKIITNHGELSKQVIIN